MNDEDQGQAKLAKIRITYNRLRDRYALDFLDPSGVADKHAGLSATAPHALAVLAGDSLVRPDAITKRGIVGTAALIATARSMGRPVYLGTIEELRERLMVGESTQGKAEAPAASPETGSGGSPAASGSTKKPEAGAEPVADPDRSLGEDPEPETRSREQEPDDAETTPPTGVDP